MTNQWFNGQLIADGMKKRFALLINFEGDLLIGMKFYILKQLTNSNLSAASTLQWNQFGDASSGNNR